MLEDLGGGGVGGGFVAHCGWGYFKIIKLEEESVSYSSE